MRQKAHCPGVEVLEGYVANQLDAVVEANFQRHLAVCGLCSELVERMRAFDGGSVAPSPEPDWTAMEAHLMQACRHQSTATGMPIVAPAKWWQGLPFIPSLGYVLALALLFPAWIGWTRRAIPPPPSPMFQARVFVSSAAAVLDFNTVRGSQTPAVLEARPGVGAAALLFFLPVGPQVRLTAEILNENGTVMANLGTIASYDPNGNFCIVASTGGWMPGRYRLVVRPQPENAQTRLPHTFPFLVR